MNKHLLNCAGYTCVCVCVCAVRGTNPFRTGPVKYSHIYVQSVDQPTASAASSNRPTVLKLKVAVDVEDGGVTRVILQTAQKKRETPTYIHIVKSGSNRHIKQSGSNSTGKDLYQQLHTAPNKKKSSYIDIKPTKPKAPNHPNHRAISQSPLLRPH